MKEKFTLARKENSSSKTRLIHTAKGLEATRKELIGAAYEINDPEMFARLLDTINHHMDEIQKDFWKAAHMMKEK